MRIAIICIWLPLVLDCELIKMNINLSTLEFYIIAQSNLIKKFISAGFETDVLH